ncbi:MAG: Mur ligase family protein, partial [Candidatus Levyibacteriota bacterium]
MKTNALILLGKTISYVSKLTNRGNGSTWPGHIALTLEKEFIQEIVKKSHLQIILVCGTNGKTTTSTTLAAMFTKSGKKVLQNTSGANLLNGIASSLLLSADKKGYIDKDVAIFEVDENALPLVLQTLIPHAIVVLNLFRDQLDRYGELDAIAKKWNDAFATLPSATKLILNADDPLIATLGKNVQADVCYFGLDEKSERKLPHAADSIYCSNCQHKLTYGAVYYSHLGNWYCTHCKNKRPRIEKIAPFFPFSGTYNKYNILAATLTARQLGVQKTSIDDALHEV